MSAQPGFFGRIKNNFTQYAAGTDDLSQLSETQQKLLRREALGRLGASLYRNGDFGDAMQQQGEINAKRLEQMQAEALRRQRLGYFDAPQELTPEQARIAAPMPAPQAPRLLQQASANTQPGVQAAQGPQRAVPAASAAVQRPVPPREQFVGAIQRAVRSGDMDHAEALRKQVDTLFPMEKFTARDMLDASGRRVVGMVGDQGTTRSTDYAPMPVAKTQELQDLADPELFARRLAIENAGATRVDTTIYGERGLSEASKRDGARLDTMRQQLSDVLAIAPQLQAAEEALMGNDTGALQGAVMEVARYLAPNSEAVSDYNTATALVVDTALQKLKGVGGNDTEKEMERIMRAVPNWRQDQATLRRLFDLSRQGLRDIINDVNSAEEAFYAPGPYQGTLYNWRPTSMGRAAAWAEQPAAGEPPRGGAGGGSRYFQIPGFEPPPAPGGRP